jgi:hypothetical protein
MDIPVTVKYKDEEVTFPLLTTAELAPVYSKLKERRLTQLRETIKEDGGLTAMERVEMIRREKAQYYNILLIQDHAQTPEGVDEIWRMSLKKAGKDDVTIARICAWPIPVDTKNLKAIVIINPYEEADATPTGVQKEATAPDAKTEAKKFFGCDNAQDALEAMAGQSAGPPFQPTPNTP